MALAPRVVVCAVCSKPFAASKPNATYCGPTCRQRAKKIRDGGGVVQLPTAKAAAPAAPAPQALTYAERFLESVRLALEEAGRLEEPLSLLALSLAEDSVNPAHPAAARRSFTAEFRATFAEALRGVRVDSAVDEVRRRRDERRRAFG